MSNEVDERIVQMEFDNAKFEKNVEQSMNTLDKLKEKLQFKNASMGLTKLERQMNDVSFDGMSASINGVSRQWTIFDSVVDQTMRNVTNKITSVVNKLATGLGNSFTYMSEGWEKYNNSIAAVQKLMGSLNTDREKGVIQALIDAEKELDETQSNFFDKMNNGDESEKGEAKLAYIEYYISKLETFSDETSYFFDSMTQSLAKFIAQGFALETSVKAVEGIAVIGAKAGANAQAVANATEQIAQFLGRNVQQQDWSSITTAGMETEWLMEALMKKASMTEEEYNQAIKNGETITEGLVEIEGKYYVASKLVQASNAKTYSGLITYIDGIKDGTKATAENTKALAEAEVTLDNFRSSLTNGWLSGKDFLAVAEDYGEFAVRIDELSKSSEAGYTPIADLQTAIGIFAEHGSDSAEALEQVDILVKKYGFDVEKLKNELEALASAELAEGRAAYEMAQESKTLGDVLGSIREAASTVWSNIFKAITGDYLQAKDLWTDINTSLYDFIIAPMQAKQELVKTWADAGGREHLWDIVKTLLNLGVAVKNTFRMAWQSVFGEGSAALDLLQTILTKIDDWAKALSGLMKKTSSDELYFGKLKDTLIAIFSFINKIWTSIKNVFGAVKEALQKLFTGFSFEEFLEKIGDAFSWVADQIVRFFNWLDSSGTLDTIRTAGSWILNTLTSIASLIPNVTGGFKSAGQSVASFFKNLFNKNGDSGVSRALTGTISEATALSKGRLKNITEGSAKVKRRGDGLGTGPVGDSSIIGRFKQTFLEANDLTRDMNNIAGEMGAQTQNIEDITDAVTEQGEALEETAGVFVWFKSLENKINKSLENWKDASRSFWVNFADTEFYRFMYTASELVYTLLTSVITFLFSTLSNLLDALTALSATNPILVAIIGEVAITLFAIRRLMKFIGWGAAALDDAAMGLYKLGQAAGKAAKAANKRAIGRLILDIAISIAAIVGAMWVMSQIDGDLDYYAKILLWFVGAFAGIATMLTVLDNLMSDDTNIIKGSKSLQINLRKSETSLQGLGLAMLSIAAAMWVFTQIPEERFEQFTIFMVTMSILLLTLAVILASMEKVSADQIEGGIRALRRFGKTIFQMTLALYPVVGALALLDMLELTPTELQTYSKELVDVLMACGALAIAMYIAGALIKMRGETSSRIPDTLKAFGDAVIEIAAAVALVAGALWIVKTTDMTPSEMWTYGGSLLGMLAIISAIMVGFSGLNSLLTKNNANYDVKSLREAGLSIATVASSMAIIAGALWLFALVEKSMPNVNLWKYVGIMAAMLGAMTVTMLLLSDWNGDSYSSSTAFLPPQKITHGKTKSTSSNKGASVEKTAKNIKDVGNAFMKVAASMSLVALSIKLMASIDSNKLWATVGAMSVILAVIGVIVSLLTDFKYDGATSNSKNVITSTSAGLKTVGLAFIEIAASMLIVGAAVYLLGKSIDSIEHPVGTMLALGTVLLAIGAILVALKNWSYNKNIKNGTRWSSTASDGLKEIGVAFLEIAASLMIVTTALWVLSFIQNTYKDQNLWSLAGMLGAFLGVIGLILVALSRFSFKSTSVSIEKASDSFASIGAAFLLIAASLLAVVGALWLLRTVPVDVIKSGGAVLAVIALAIGGAMAIMAHSFKSKGIGEMFSMVAVFGLVAAALAGLIWTFSFVAAVPVGRIIAAGAVAIMAAFSIVAIIALLKSISNNVNFPKLFLAIGVFGAIMAAILLLTVAFKDIASASLKTIITASAIILGIGFAITGIIAILMALDYKQSSGDMITGFKAMSDALVNLAQSLVVLSAIPVGDLIKAVVALLAASTVFAGLIAISALFANKSAGIFTISEACVVFSVALILAGLAAEIFVDATIRLLNAFVSLSTMTDEEVRRSSNAMSSFINIVGDALDVFIKSMLEGFIGFLGTIVENSGLVMEAIFVVVDGIVDALVRLLDKINEIVLELVMVVIRGIANGIVELMKLLTEKMPEITEFIKSVVTSLVEVIVSALDLILEKLTEEVDFVNHKSRIQVWTESLVTIIFDSLIGAINATADAIEPLIDSIIKLIIAVINGAGEAMYKNAGDFADAVNNFVSNLIATIITVLTGVSVIKQLKDGITKAITGGMSESTGKNGEMGKKIKESFKSIGTDILNGIWEGIKSAWDTLKRVVEEVGGAVLTLFERIFDIDSPSKEMAEMGMYLDQGLAQGITKNATTVSRSVNNLANTTISPLQEAFSDLSTYIDENVDTQPTIRPVMDLTDIQNGANSIYGMMTGMDDLNMRGSINATGEAAKSMKYSNVPGYSGQTVTSNTENNNITNNFNITGDNPKEIANEVSRILQEQVGRRNKVWA